MPLKSDPFSQNSTHEAEYWDLGIVIKSWIIRFSHSWKSHWHLFHRKLPLKVSFSIFAWSKIWCKTVRHGECFSM